MDTVGAEWSFTQEPVSQASIGSSHNYQHKCETCQTPAYVVSNKDFLFVKGLISKKNCTQKGAFSI